MFMGQVTIQAEALLPHLLNHGYEVTVVSTHGNWCTKIADTDIPVFNLYESNRTSLLFNGPLENYRKHAYYSLAKKVDLKDNKLKQIVNEAKPDIIYGSWGSQSLPEIGLAQKFNVPTAYEFLTYPVSSNILTEKIENFFNKPVVNDLDGRVFSTQRMSNYIKSKFDPPAGENMVLMECYPEKFYFGKRLPLLSESDGQPHIVFIGMDVDEVFPQIKEIASRKIHVHIVEPTEAGWNENGTGDPTIRVGSDNSGFIHQFKRFSADDIADGTLATFLTQFDACLVTYNFWSASSLNRFANSIPSRFSIALLAGIPIIVPEGYLKGCEDVIEEHNIGFAYKSYSELSNKLYDKKVLNLCQNNSVNNSKFFSLESNFGKIDKFIKRIINY